MSNYNQAVFRPPDYNPLSAISPTTKHDLTNAGPPPLVAKTPTTPTTAPTTYRRTSRQIGNLDDITTAKYNGKRQLVKREFVVNDDKSTTTNYERLTANYDDIQDRKPELTPADVADIKRAKLKVRVGALMKAYWSDGFTVRGLEKLMKDERHFSNGNIIKYYAIINAKFYRQTA